MWNTLLIVYWISKTAYPITNQIEILNTLSHYYPEDNKHHEKLHTRWNLGRYPGQNTVQNYPNRDLKEASIMWAKKGKQANCLLGLRRLGLVFSSTLQRIWGVFSIKDIIPPPEAAGIIANELLMVEIVVIGTSPEGKEMVKTPWKFVTTVSINGLEQA